ncbi:MAG TPA: hypothetical protein VKV77_04805 [Methylovirgula sp.]|nr:hypothetical protein [Methylovirgula sp.]
MARVFATRGFLLIILLIPMAGCAPIDAQIAQTARKSLVGMSELDLETCLGLPDQKVTSGKTTIYTYYVNSTRTLDLTVPVINVVSASFSGYCHATFRLENDKVTQVRYSGDTNDPVTGAKDTVCAPIVRSCVESRGGSH